MKKNILVLFGGCSAEYPVSLQSAYSVLTHMDRNRYEIIPVGITREGKWLRYHGELSHIADDTWHERKADCTHAVLSPDRTVHGICDLSESGLKSTYIDAVFPVLHGKNGEDGSIQGLAELAGIPIIGCKTLASALCMDKHRAHQIASLAGVSVPKAVHFTEKPSQKEAEEATAKLRYPLYVKPLRGGSSIGMSKIHEETELMDAINLAFQYDSEALIEENIEGFEVGCSVLGRENLTIGRVDEIELCCDFFDYEEKYTQNYTKIHMPARIDEATEARIQKTAAKVYKALSCSGFARVDLFLTPAGEIVFNEVNTIPGCTCHSRFPKMLAGIGMSFEEIIERLIEDALSDAER